MLGKIVFQPLCQFRRSRLDPMEFCEVSSVICHAPKWLNKDFIETSLRLGKKDPKLTVSKLTISPATAPGDNYVSELYRVNFELVNNGKRQSLIIKCLPTSEYNLKFIKDARLFEKEIRFYNYTLPAMGVQILAPQCLYTRDDLLVLEDLSARGYKVVSRLFGLDLEHSCAAIKALARYHATSLSLPALELVNDFPETMYHDKDHAFRYIKHSLTSLATIVNGWNGYERFADLILCMSGTVLERVLNLMPRTAPETLSHFFVLNHGDFWTNNIMFSYEGSDVKDVKLLDFQMCRYAPCSLDLQYFLYTSLHEIDETCSNSILLEEYRLELCRTLNQDNYITADQLVAEMERTNLFGFINACMMLPVVLSDPKTNSPDLGNVAKANHKDSNTLEWHHGSDFRKRFQKLLLHFESKGLFSSQ